jgi:hypothetical protein
MQFHKEGKKAMQSAAITWPLYTVTSTPYESSSSTWIDHAEGIEYQSTAWTTVSTIKNKTNRDP